MTDNTPSNDYEKLLKAFDELFDEMLMQDPEEADDILREAGYNPDEIGARLENVAKQIITASPLNWRNRAREESEIAKAQLNKMTSTAKHDRSQVLARIQDLLLRLPGQVGAHYRNLDTATDHDLENTLAELEFLALQQNPKKDGN